MKPILFNTDMVRAILEGRKTVTRRVVKPQPDGQPVLMGEDSCWPGYFSIQGTEKVIRPPYRPGDILWVRETWQAVYETEWSNDEPYKGQNIRELIPNFDSIQKVEAGLSQECSSMAMRPRMKYFVFKASDIECADNENGLVWRPSIHMPREAARIFLRVTGVRVDRLQELTLKDAAMEGMDLRGPMFTKFVELWNGTVQKHPNKFKRYPYCWEDNPWVWVIEFEQIGEEDEERS